MNITTMKIQVKISSLLKLMTGELRAEANPGTSCQLFGEELWCLEELRHRVGIVMPEEVGRFDPAEIAGDRSPHDLAHGAGQLHARRPRAHNDECQHGAPPCIV